MNSLTKKTPRKHMLINSVGQTSEKLIFKMAEDVGHLGFQGRNEVK